MTDCISKITCDTEKKIKSKTCEHLSPLPKNIILKCGETGGNATFTSPSNPPVVITSIQLDTTCFKKPKIKFEFSSTVDYEGPLIPSVLGVTQTSEVVLDYSLVCERDGIETVIGTWTYKRSSIGVPSTGPPSIAITYADTFSFDECIKNSCSGCVTYFVRVAARVVSQQSIPIDNNQNLILVEPIARATVSNGQLIAFVQES